MFKEYHYSWLANGRFQTKVAHKELSIGEITDCFYFDCFYYRE